MKSLKTFNLSHDCIRLIRSKANQSDYCERAIYLKHNQEKKRQEEIDAIDISDVTTKRLLVILGLRTDVPKHIRTLINQHLYE